MKQTTKLFLLVLYVLLSASSATAQLKPEAMMLPIDFSGVKSSEYRAILQNHVLTELSAYYDLKSEQEVESARDAAIDKLSSENCTEEACVKIMGELLDVEHTFTFSVIAAGNYWDLSATRLDYFGTTARRNSACEQCTLPNARKILTELLVGLRPGTAVIKHGEAILTLASEPRALVFWEGIEQGSTPLELTVPTDRPAEILAVAEGYQDYSNLFELKAGESRKINIRLVRRRGRIEITSAPSGADIFLDGKPLTASGGQPLRTPSKIRPEYGEHTLTLKLEKHQDVKTQLSINRPNVGTKKYSLQPNPGRLIVRVPSEFKTADVYVNDRKIGNMGGKIAKSFAVKANVSLRIQAKRRDFESDVQRVKIEPEAFMKIEMIFPLKASLPLKAQVIQKKAAEIVKSAGTVIVPSTGLMWQRKPDWKKRNWDDAKRYCRNLSLGGFSDWELPSKDVLQTMYAYKSGKRYTEIELHSMFPGIKSSRYWSSTTDVNFTTNAWSVLFGYGLDVNLYGFSKTQNYYVRCVRGGRYEITPKAQVIQKKAAEIVKSAGTVIDQRTGLMWQKRPDGKARNWVDAKRYCRNLSNGGYSDWELPSKNVLQAMFAYKNAGVRYIKGDRLIIF